MTQLDIIIPVYNEGENILEVLEGLDGFVRTPARVLIGYDREEDSTLPAVKRFQPRRLKVELLKNEGRGAHGAVMTGFRRSDAPAVLVFPADDTFNAPVIDRMVEEFNEGADIVAASRFMKGGCMKGCPWLKAVLVRTAAFTLHHVARLPTHDPTNGFRLFSRRVVREIPVESDRGFAFSMELLVKAHRRGWKVREVPSVWIERKEGKSRFRIFRWLPVYLRWYLEAFTPFLRTAAVVWAAAIVWTYLSLVIFSKIQDRL